MVTKTRIHLARASAAGIVSLASLALLALPAEAAESSGSRQARAVSNLVSTLLGSPQRSAQAATPPPQAAPTTGGPTTTTTTVSGGSLSGTLQEGSKGAQVKTLEARLDTLHYFVGPIDETYDEETMQAVMAFQKVNRMDRTGVVDQATWSAINTAKDPGPLVSGGASKRVEVDLDRQVLFLYQGGKLSKILPVSTGNGEDYCEGGSCGTAITPTGDFSIYRQGSGWEYGPLGGLYNPQYFQGGYAIHGSLSVPAEPASHGCVRIPMGAADWFPGQVSNGTPVHIR